MKYVVNNPKPWGSVVSLYSVAEAMARDYATSADGFFNEAAYEGRLNDLVNDLVHDVQSGALKVCNQRGFPRQLQDVLTEAKAKGAFLRTDATGTSLSAFVSLAQLNEWGHSLGLEFAVNHSGVSWVDERGFQQGVFEVSRTVEAGETSEHKHQHHHGLIGRSEQQEVEAIEKVWPIDLLATPEELVEAFGRFSGMNPAWFRRLDDRPELKKAKKREGVAGKRYQKPLFCPFEVMTYLISPRRRSKRNLTEDKAWELLERYFNRVYQKKSIGDPRS